MSSLLFALLVPGPPGSRRATLRDRLSDTIAVLSALAYGAVMVPLGDATSPHAAIPWPADVAIGLACAGALVVRRRHPLGLCLALLPFGVVSVMASGPILVALFTVAIRHRALPVLGLAVLHIGAGAVYYALQPDPPMDLWVDLVLRSVTALAAVGWGSFIRAYRRLTSSLRTEADNARAQAQLRLEQARLTERSRIAREMHDVLAHRMSMVSLHAGALEVRTDADPADIAAAARAIRISSHEALEELRAVIGVLRRPDDATYDHTQHDSAHGWPHTDNGIPDRGRAGVGDGAPPELARVRAEPPQPRFSDLPDLLTEARSSGMNVDFVWLAPRSAPSPDVERTAYRVVQEALTNARKHAPGGDVEVRLEGGVAEELRILVTNYLSTHTDRPAAPPGSGTGLIGVGERVALAGGRVEYGLEGEKFRLEAWLPWSE